ncbi:amidohydrolase family protein [Streptomyces beijiangensis]|uniref:Amidohydrolase family protein n=1 Tax=Streptomyces beijiangensis TaxID=163361 RepID=A0A939FDW1_9ACTN|nr:amidohydrolase family protein [Streptomyces beijiangensis]MBO0517300.1 amidohydrolase family protein [Streptomyces beijiangensis]
MTDLILRDARVEDATRTSDIVVEAGRITAVRPPGTGTDRPYESIDCAGRIVLPGFVEAHIHPDKALLDGLGSPRGTTLADAIAVTLDLKRGFGHDDVYDRSRRVIESAILNGTTTLRAHPDVDPVAGLLGVEVLLELREKYRQFIDIQIVAFPQEGIVRSPGTEKLLRAALTAGADVVGGCSYQEDSVEDCRRHVDLVLDLAAEYDVPADLHADFADDAGDPRYTMAEYIADATRRRGLGGRVTLGHMTSLSGRPPLERAATAAKLASHGVNVVPLPATDLHLGGRIDTQAVRRGVAPVRELWDAGVVTATATNNIRNAFTPYGTGDLLDIALLLAQTGHLSGPADLRRVLRMVTYDAARVIGIAEHYGVREGAIADLVVLDTTRYDDIVLDRPERAYVIKAGRIVARSTRTRQLVNAPAA